MDNSILYDFIKITMKTIKVILMQLGLVFIGASAVWISKDTPSVMDTEAYEAYLRLGKAVCTVDILLVLTWTILHICSEEF